jgi:hypothetical protein
MNRRILLIGLAWALCLGSVSAVWIQQNRLANLRARLRTSDNANNHIAGGSSAPDTLTQSAGSNALSDEESRELLRLRAEVTALTARKRELAGVVEASEQLHKQLNAPATNSGGVPLPEGYVRRANAQFLGYGTPEATVQSWLWAIQHHDIEKLLGALTPEYASKQGDLETVFKRMEALPGLSILGHEDLPDHSVELQVLIGPNVPPMKLHFQFLEGEWKMEER